MAKSHLKLVTPATVKRTVTPTRRRNGDLRTREYLTEPEVERLMKAATGNRHGHRDATMILVAYRHGLGAGRPALGSGGVQNGHPARPQGQIGHAQHASDTRRRAASPAAASARTGAQIAIRVHVRAWGTVHHRRLRPDARTTGTEAKFGFKPHPHMLRHACGYELANRGHDTRALQAYLGQKNIQHTVQYTELSPTRFKNFWRE
jgi:type 1 fimbriae regulatory protein FimB/type 1 fimbriae regulatory protein FimE